jgi:4-hydroxybenzoate polyprenyltransferase
MIFLHIKIKDRSREACFDAFRQSHWIGISVLIGLMLAYI